MPYSPFIDRLLRDPELFKKLFPTETLHLDERDAVRKSDDATIAGAQKIARPAEFALVRGGLLYALDAIHEAHVYFQDNTGDLAAYWHGMMHRREGDFDNARYWFRRAGTQPFFATAHSAAAAHSADMARQSNWDPYLFTGECEQAKFGAENVAELLALQRVEFDAAFDYTWRQAVGAR
jgi:hypothetical protein